jgi:hypothetical protein
MDRLGAVSKVETKNFTDITNSHDCLDWPRCAAVFFDYNPPPRTVVLIPEQVHLTFYEIQTAIPSNEGGAIYWH